MLARKSALIIITNILNAVMGYFAIFFVARFMDSPDYALGVVSFAYGFVNIFYVFSDLGFERAHVKRISEGRSFEECMGTFAVIKILLTGLMAVLLFVSLFVWTDLFGRGFESLVLEKAIYVMLCYFILWSFTQVFRITFMAKKEIAKAELPMFFETLGRVVATFIVVFMGLGILALAYTYIVGEIAVFFTSLYFFRGYKLKKPSLEYFRLYCKFAFPLAIVVASSIIMINIDKVLIQLFWGAVEGGNYFAVFRLSRFIDMSTVAIGILLFPTMSALFVGKNMSSMKRLSVKSERYLSMIIFPIVFMMVFLARPIIHVLLSDTFYPAVPILQILPFFALFDALEHPYQVKLLGMDLPKLARNRIIIMVFVNIVLNVLLIPKDINILGVKLAGMGAVGAAIATVIAYFTGLVYTRILVWKISKIKFNYKIILHLFAALVMGVSLFYLNNFYAIYRWYELVCFGFLGIGIYLGVLYIMREFTREDFNLFMDTLNIKKMITYIRDEFKGK